MPGRQVVQATRDPVAGVNRDLRTCFVRLADRVPGGETCRFGLLAGASTGLPNPIYDRVLVFDPPVRSCSSVWNR
jgi:hypothetical protein